MKALRSSLARQVLADPKSRVILREAAAAPDRPDRSSSSRVALQLDGKTRVFEPVLVRKAA